ncbi:MAG: phosphoribosylaminoimidazole carboxylase [Bdellovibrio sp.]|nr:MAG: phosphoribosylaminoimidazole carboxylase [Bdellovibrio sp.]
MTKENLFKNVPQRLSEEVFETLQPLGKSSKIERIISKGHASPVNFWYDQTDNEWVLVVKGRAGLRFEGQEVIELVPGDYVNIPAHARHRVEWTDQDQETIWLAVFY